MGAHTAQQCIKAGLLDAIQMHRAPILLSTCGHVWGFVSAGMYLLVTLWHNNVGTAERLSRAAGQRRGSAYITRKVQHSITTADRLSMPLGEAIFSLRAIRRLKPDSIPDADIRDILEAAIRAPNGGNTQPWHFLAVKDPALRAQFAALYHEAWWAKRRDAGIHTPEDLPPNYRLSMCLANEIGQVQVVILVCATAKGVGPMGSVIPAVQNLLLAARALGIGGTITTLHPQVDERVHELFGIPPTAQVVYCIPLGYPRGHFGPNKRKPLREVCSYDHWGSASPWDAS